MKTPMASSRTVFDSGSISSPNLSRCERQIPLTRGKSSPATEELIEPLIRTIPTPPSPGGVAIATTESASNYAEGRYPESLRGAITTRRAIPMPILYVSMSGFSLRHRWMTRRSLAGIASKVNGRPSRATR